MGLWIHKKNDLKVSVKTKGALLGTVSTNLELYNPEIAVIAQPMSQIMLKKKSVWEQ